jgi:hypothetical protein
MPSPADDKQSQKEIPLKTSKIRKDPRIRPVIARVHQRIGMRTDTGERIRVDLDYVPDAQEPHALLTVYDPDGAVRSITRVPASFELTAEAVRTRVSGPSA